MKCVICQYGETEPGTTTVTLTRDETTVVIRDVPAQICTTCGEEYVDAATGKRLAQIAETAIVRSSRVVLSAPCHAEPFASLRVNSAKHLAAHRARSFASLRMTLLGHLG